jgi:hypothetical protein
MAMNICTRYRGYVYASFTHRASSRPLASRTNVMNVECDVIDMRKFQAHYPDWSYTYDLRGILDEIHDSHCVRMTRTA